jgi:hypothetical protein
MANSAAMARELRLQSRLVALGILFGLVAGIILSRSWHTNSGYAKDDFLNELKEEKARAEKAVTIKFVFDDGFQGQVEVCLDAVHGIDVSPRNGVITIPIGRTKRVYVKSFKRFKESTSLTPITKVEKEFHGMGRRRLIYRARWSLTVGD